MKRIITAVLITVITLSLASCGKNSLKFGKESTVKEGTTFDVSMNIVDGTVSATGMTVQVINNTDMEIESGNAFDMAIEVLKDDRWYSIETDEMANTAEALGFEGTCEIEFDWSRIYGGLPKGKYRLVKWFWPWAEDGTYGLDDMFCLTAEFSIE